MQLYELIFLNFSLKVMSELIWDSKFMLNYIRRDYGNYQTLNLSSHLA